MIVEGAKLICLNKDGSEAKTYKPFGRKLTAGYYISNDVILEDSRASSIHCEIQFDSYGKVIIYNFSSNYPISVNSVTVNIKMPLLSGYQITILDENYLWVYHKTSFAYTSCPNLSKTMHPIMPKNLTRYNASHRYSLSNNNNSPVDLGDSVILPFSKNTETTDITRNVESMALKDTLKLAKQTVLKSCQMSDVVVTSFTPQKSGEQLEKSFITILKKSSKNACSTPTNLLTKLNNRSKLFFTPTSSNRSFHIFNSPVHVIDFTTPIKPIPSNKTENKNDKSVNSSFLTSESKLGFDNNDESSYTSNSSSIISINSTDSQSAIEVSSGESSLSLSSKIKMNTISIAENSSISNMSLKETNLNDEKIKLFTDINISENKICYSILNKNGENCKAFGYNIRNLKKNMTTLKKVNERKNSLYYQDIANHMQSKNIANIYKEYNVRNMLSDFNSLNKTYVIKTKANLYSKICNSTNNESVKKQCKILKVNYAASNVHKNNLDLCNIKYLKKHNKVKIYQTNEAIYGCLDKLHCLPTDNEILKTYFMKKKKFNEVKLIFNDFHEEKYTTFKENAVSNKDNRLYQNKYSRIQYTFFLNNVEVAAKLNMLLFCNKLMNFFLTKTSDLQQCSFSSIDVDSSCLLSKTENIRFFVKEGKIRDLSSFCIYLRNYVEDANRFYSNCISCVNYLLRTVTKDKCFKNYTINETGKKIIELFIAKLLYVTSTDIPHILNLIMEEYDEFLFQNNYIHDLLFDKTKKKINKIKNKKIYDKIRSKIYKNNLIFSTPKLFCGKRRLTVEKNLQMALTDNKSSLISSSSGLINSDIVFLARNQKRNYTNIQLVKEYTKNDLTFCLEEKLIKDINFFISPNFVKTIFNAYKNEDISVFTKIFKGNKNNFDEGNTLKYSDIKLMEFFADRKKNLSNCIENSNVKLMENFDETKNYKIITKPKCINPKKENCKYLTRLQRRQNNFQCNIISDNSLKLNCYDNQENVDEREIEIEIEIEKNYLSKFNEFNEVETATKDIDEKCVYRPKKEITESGIMPCLNKSKNDLIENEKSSQEIACSFYGINENKLNNEYINTTKNNFQINESIFPKNITACVTKYELRSRKVRDTKCNIPKNVDNKQFLNDESMEDKSKTKKPNVKSKKKPSSRTKKNQTILDNSCNATSTNKNMKKEKISLQKSPLKCSSSENLQTISDTRKGYLLRSRKK